MKKRVTGTPRRRRDRRCMLRRARPSGRDMLKVESRIIDRVYSRRYRKCTSAKWLDWLYRSARTLTLHARLGIKPAFLSKRVNFSGNLVTEGRDCKNWDDLTKKQLSSLFVLTTVGYKKEN